MAWLPEGSNTHTRSVTADLLFGEWKSHNCSIEIVPDDRQAIIGRDRMTELELRMQQLWRFGSNCCICEPKSSKLSRPRREGLSSGTISKEQLGDFHSPNSSSVVIVPRFGMWELFTPVQFDKFSLSSKTAVLLNCRIPSASDLRILVISEPESTKLKIDTPPTLIWAS